MEKWQITYKRTPIRLPADFSTETLITCVKRSHIYGIIQKEPETGDINFLAHLTLISFEPYTVYIIKIKYKNNSVQKSIM